MIARYSRPKMTSIWSEKNKWNKMLQVEVAVALAQAQLKIIPRAAALAIQKKGRFQLERISEIESQTKHDVIAFVSNVAENIGPYGAYVHYGMTSSDILDTGLSLLVQEAYQEMRQQLVQLEKVYRDKIKKYKSTLCAGRTHGMHAELTTFGYKLAGHWAELERLLRRFDRAAEEMRVAKLSGAIGTYSTSLEAVEKKVARKLNLEVEKIATQVIPRDRHAYLMSCFALLAGFLERVSVELRHLQRTEVSEVFEKFSSGQKGSSAMPHKKNPISAENLSGLARLLRSYAMASYENMSLWHERDISHSSVERVILPDAFILADYAIHRLTELIQGLVVDSQQMIENIHLSKGKLFSSQLLLALIDKGLSREEAYKIVQEMTMNLKAHDNLMASALKNTEVKKLLSSSEIKKIFSFSAQGQRISARLEKVMREKK